MLQIKNNRHGCYYYQKVLRNVTPYNHTPIAMWSGFMRIHGITKMNAPHI